MSNISNDLDAIVTGAVQARVEAQVLATMADSEVLSTFVTAALSTKVETGRYGSESRTLLSHLLRTSVEEQTKAVVAEEMEKLKPLIRDEVRHALAKSIGVIADSLVDGFVASAPGRRPSIQVSFGDA